MTEDAARRKAEGVTPTSEIASDHGAGRSSAEGAGATFAAGTRRRAEKRRRQAGYRISPSVSLGATCLPRSAKRVPRGRPAPECLARCGALRTQRSRYFCAQCFSFARGMEAHHWGPPSAVVMRLLCRPPAFTRAPKGGSGGTPGLVLKALLRARPARRSKTDAPHPLGGGGARGNAWVK